jgi:hypothetical protein
MGHTHSSLVFRLGGSTVKSSRDRDVMTRRDVRFQTVEVETLNQDYVENRDFMVSRLSRSALFFVEIESLNRDTIKTN